MNATKKMQLESEIQRELAIAELEYETPKDEEQIPHDFIFVSLPQDDIWGQGVIVRAETYNEALKISSEVQFNNPGLGMFVPYTFRRDVNTIEYGPQFYALEEFEKLHMLIRQHGERYTGKMRHDERNSERLLREHRISMRY